MAARLKGRERRRSPVAPSGTPLTFYRSAGKSPNDASPFENKPKKPKGSTLLPKIVDASLLILIVAGLVYCMVISSQPEINLNSELYHPSSEYERAATEELASLKNRNKLTFDEKSVVNALEDKFPEIDTALIDISLFGKTPKLNIAVAGPAFVLHSRGQEYVINTRGVAVAEYSDLPSLKGLPTVIDETGFPIELGRQVVSTGQVGFINTLIAQLKRAKVPIATMVLPAKAQELDLRTKDRAYFTKLFLGGDPMTQAGQYLAARHQFDHSAKQPSKYLDVRVDGKIYYL